MDVAACFALLLVLWLLFRLLLRRAGGDQTSCKPGLFNAARLHVVLERMVYLINLTEWCKNTAEERVENAASLLLSLLHCMVKLQNPNQAW